MKYYERTGLRSTASGFALAGCILFSLLIIPMCWMIPMTVSIRRRIRQNRNVPLGLSICYIIFGGIFATVAGILLCVDFGTNKGKEIKEPANKHGGKK